MPLYKAPCRKLKHGLRRRIQHMLTEALRILVRSRVRQRVEERVLANLIRAKAKARARNPIMYQPLHHLDVWAEPKMGGTFASTITGQEAAALLTSLLAGLVTRVFTFAEEQVAMETMLLSTALITCNDRGCALRAPT